MAYEIGYDIVVDDDNCASTGKEYIDLGAAFEERLNTYLSALERILEGAVQEGKTADNLRIFKETAESLKEEVAELSEKASGYMDSFVEDMDTADSYLY